MTTRIILALLATLLTTTSQAQTTAYLHGLSEHYVHCESPCNETNYGLSVKHTVADRRFIHVGAFQNSQHNPAAFGTYGWQRQWRGFEIGAAAGLAVGYVDKMGVTDAGIVPTFLLSIERGPVYVAVIPGAVSLALRIPLRVGVE